jgi:hypothetical protein
MKNFSFQPHITETAHLLHEQNHQFHEPTPVFQRLTDVSSYKEGIKNKLDQIRKEVSKEWTFKPHLPERTVDILHSK